MTELVSSLDTLLRIFGGRTTVLRCIDMLSIEDRRTALRYLLDSGTTAYPESIQDATGLPQRLRGAIHELTRTYAANLIVDAAMLAMPEEHRQEVARAFLPREERKPEVRKYQLVDEETGDVLWQGDEPFQPMKFDYVATDGSSRGYQREGGMVFQFGPGADCILGQTYYRSLESLAEEEEKRHVSLREKLDERREEKKARLAQLYTLVDAASGEELGKVEPNALNHHVRIIDSKTGQPVDYVQVRVIPEYDFREKDDAAPRMLAIYRKVTAE